MFYSDLVEELCSVAAGLSRNYCEEDDTPLEEFGLIREHLVLGKYHRYPFWQIKIVRHSENLLSFAIAAHRKRPFIDNVHGATLVSYPSTTPTSSGEFFPHRASLVTRGTVLASSHEIVIKKGQISSRDCVLHSALNCVFTRDLLSRVYPYPSRTPQVSVPKSPYLPLFPDHPGHLMFIV